jgi:hypothetical protein
MQCHRAYSSYTFKKEKWGMTHTGHINLPFLPISISDQEKQKNIKKKKRGGLGQNLLILTSSYPPLAKQYSLNTTL